MSKHSDDGALRSVLGVLVPLGVGIGAGWWLKGFWGRKHVIAGGGFVNPFGVDGKMTLLDFEKEAIEKMENRHAVNYYSFKQPVGLTEMGHRSFMNSLRLMPHVLTGNVGEVDLSIDVFGEKARLPVLIAPTAFHTGATAEGECATAEAANLLSVVYSYNFFLSDRRMEDVVKKSDGRLLWLHLYLFKERDCVEKALKMAEATGKFKAVIVTCDHPHQRVKQYNVAHVMNMWAERGGNDAEFVPNMWHALGYGKPYTVGDVLRDEMGEILDKMATDDPNLSWEDMKWLKSKTKLPIVLKGIINPEDAKIAVSIGADAIVVSNHGFRQMDGSPSAIEMLPQVVEAIKGSNIPVYVDSGFRTSMDILKAIALGAHGVFLGRPILYGLGCGNLHGMFERLKFDLECDMQCLGLSSLEQLRKNASHIVYKTQS